MNNFSLIKETAVTCIVRNLDTKHNAIRLSTIILDIGTKVIRAHIQRFLDLNNYNNVNELINNKKVSNGMLNKLKKGCFGNIPDSLDKFDITKSFALIDNIFNELHKTSKFNYDDKSYDYCKRLKNIRNQKYAHIFFFEMEDVDFSVTVVTIEEIIRQLCDYDNSLCKDYLDKIEIELNKDNNEINNLKSDVIKMLSELHEQTEIIKQIDSKTSQIEPNHAENREEFRKINSKLDTITNKPDKPETSTIDLACNLPPCPPASKLHKRENETEIFAELPDHKLICIAGMAGVGKSTLAITYGHHRQQVNKAKVSF